MPEAIRADKNRSRSRSEPDRESAPTATAGHAVAHAGLVPVPGVSVGHLTIRRVDNPFHGVNMSDEQSLDYHYKKHGAGHTKEQYMQDAADFAASPTGKATSVTLADGSTGTRYRTPRAPGGILDSDGNVVTFWYD